MIVTISRRSRNLGYGWSNTPKQTPQGLIIETPIRPQVTGGPATVFAEVARAARLNSGNSWNQALFVAGQRIVRIVGEGDSWVVHNVLDYLADPSFGPVGVEVEDKHQR